MMSEIENEINNRFLDIREILQRDFPDGDVDLYLRIYLQETLLRFYSISYQFQRDEKYKEPICKLYLEARLYKEKLELQLKSKSGGSLG